MSIRAIAELRRTYIRDFNREPSELRVGREMLDAIADDTVKVLPHARRMSAQEWRDHLAQQARAGELFLYGIPVVLKP